MQTLFSPYLSPLTFRFTQRALNGTVGSRDAGSAMQPLVDITFQIYQSQWAILILKLCLAVQALMSLLRVVLIVLNYVCFRQL